MVQRTNVHNPSNPEFSDTPTYYKKEEWGDLYRTDVLSAIDWLGHQFRVGDNVMYCIGAGRGQMMAIGEVKAIRATEKQELKSWDWEAQPDGRSKCVNEVWEDYWDIEVQVLTTKTSGAWDNTKRTRPAWVNPMNITAFGSL